MDKSCTLVFFFSLFIFIYTPCSSSIQLNDNIDSLLIRLETATLDTTKIQLHIQLSEAYSKVDLKMALKHSQESVVMAEESKNPGILAQALKNAGKAGFYAGLYDLSISYFNRYLELMKELKLLPELGHAYFNVGAVKLTLGDLESAEEHFQKAYQIITNHYIELNEIPPPTTMLSFYNNLGIVYREKGDYIPAVESFAKGIELARTSPEYLKNLTDLLNNYGELLIIQKEYAEAAIVLQESKEISRIINDKRSESAILSSLGKLEMINGQPASAENLLKRALNIAFEAGGLSMIINHSELLHQLYKSTGKADSALKYLEVAVEYDNKLNQSKAKEEINRQELIHEYREREQIRSAQHQLKQMRSLIIMITLLFISIISVLLVALLWKKNKKTRSEMVKVVKEANELKATNQTKDKLISIISHDLRGPIGNLNKGLEMLTSGEINDEEMITRFLDEMNTASKNTYNLVENLLNWSRSQTNSILLKPRSCSVSRLINNNVTLFSSGANQKNIQIGVEICDDLNVFCDRETINIVIRNLLSNAVKFTPNQGSIKVSAKQSGNDIEIEVADTGIGMKEEALENLFISDYKSTYGTNGEKGSGIGMALCDDFVRRNGGRIRVESKLNEGSRFTIVLPADSSHLSANDTISVTSSTI